jgi:Flp pilus assembly protein TadG
LREAVTTSFSAGRRAAKRGERRRDILGCALERRGSAAIELAIIGPVIGLALLNAVDIGRYFYQKMEVQNAAQSGAQAAWSSCTMAQLPATLNCSGLNAAVTAAVQATSLGTSVTLASGSPSEAYYCVNSSGALVDVATVSNPPSDCSSVGNSTGTPGDYIVVQVSFAYSPIFPGLSVAGAFPTPTTSTSMMRLR